MSKVMHAPEFYTVAKLKEAPKQTASGIIIPESAKGEFLEGEVMTDGFAKPGDTVLFYPTAGRRFKLEGVQYVTLRDTDCLAILRGAEGER